VGNGLVSQESYQDQKHHKAWDKQTFGDSTTQLVNVEQKLEDLHTMYITNYFNVDTLAEIHILEKEKSRLLA